VRASKDRAELPRWVNSPVRVGRWAAQPQERDAGLLDVVRSNAHDAYHHWWDIKWSLQAEAL